MNDSKTPVLEIDFLKFDNGLLLHSSLCTLSHHLSRLRSCLAAKHLDDANRIIPDIAEVMEQIGFKLS